MAGGGDLVDLVDVNDAVLGALHIVVRAAVQLAHDVLHVAADVARLGKFRRVRLHERHADQIGDAADQVGFADAGGADEDDVLLGVIRLLLALERQPHMVVMVAERDADDFLGLVLLDDVAVQIGLHLARFFRERENVFLSLSLSLMALRRVGRAHAPENRRTTGAQMLAHELAQLPLEFFRRRRTVPNWFLHNQKVTLSGCGTAASAGTIFLTTNGHE